MWPLDLINEIYVQQDVAKRALLAHSHQVKKLALEVACLLQSQTEVNIEFVEEASLLHDIGILHTYAPEIGCHGSHPYITHGIIGSELLRKRRMHQHALVCERHIGVGLSKEDIKSQALPLPLRDMRPQSLEEEIIAYADLFFSKTRKGMRTPEEIRASLARHGPHKVVIFDAWHQRFRVSN